MLYRDEMLRSVINKISESNDVRVPSSVSFCLIWSANSPFWSVLSTSTMISMSLDHAVQSLSSSFILFIISDPIFGKLDSFSRHLSLNFW